MTPISASDFRLLTDAEKYGLYAEAVRAVQVPRPEVAATSWTPISDPPQVSSWRWIEFWTEYGAAVKPEIRRFIAGDKLPNYATFWRFLDHPPRPQRDVRQEKP